MMSCSVKQNTYFPVEDDLMLLGIGETKSGQSIKNLIKKCYSAP